MVPRPANVRPVVVGVDGSPSSVRALKRAARISAALHIPLEGITAWREPFFFGTVASAFEPESAPLIEAAGATLRDAAQRAFGDAMPDQYQGRVLQGAAAEVLLTAGKGAELLVVGSRGRGGFAGVLLGSVSRAVAEYASCPVLVLHGDDEPSDADERSRSDNGPVRP